MAKNIPPNTLSAMLEFARLVTNGNKPEEGKIQPDWGAIIEETVVNIGPIGDEFGPVYEPGHYSPTIYDLKKTEISFNSWGEDYGTFEKLEKMAMASGLGPVKVASRDMDGVIVEWYRFRKVK